MLTILPVRSGPEIQAIRQDDPTIPDGAVCFLMADSSGQQYGWIAASVKETVLELVSLRLWEQAETLGAAFCADSLVRAAASYGEIKGALRIECRQKDLYPVLLAAGFSQEEEKCCAPVSALVKSSKETR